MRALYAAFLLASPTSIRSDDLVTRMSSPLQWSRLSTNTFQGPGEAAWQVGFGRFDAPDPEQPELIETAKLGRAGTPGWVPGSEVRGEGVFVRLEEDRLAAWEGSSR
jgi:hypothetical protein